MSCWQPCDHDNRLQLTGKESGRTMRSPVGTLAPVGGRKWDALTISKGSLMTKPQRVLGPKRFLRAPKEYDYIAIEHDGAAIAHVFVAPQELTGLEVGYIDPVEDESEVTVGGDVMIGNPNDGYYTVAFETKIEKGSAQRLLLGENEYELRNGIAFVIKPGYRVSQLRCQSKAEALSNLH